MSVPLATDTFVVQRPGLPDSAPVRGHASPQRVARLDGNSPAGIAQEAAYTVLLDPDVPVTEESRLVASGGEVFRVRTALRRRGTSPALDHWTTTCTRVTNDTTADTGVDAEGNVERVP